MNYKLLKLNIKIYLMNLFGHFNANAKVSNFTSEEIQNPNILVIFPVERSLIREAMECISKVVSIHENNNSQFSFIINKDNILDTNFFSIKSIPIEVKKERVVTSSANILNKLRNQSFDIVVNLNADFNIDIDMLIEKINAKYKIGFVSKYSDLFYNIQLNWDESKSRFSPVMNILGY